MSAKNYFKDGGSWIRGKLVVGEKVFCKYNAQGVTIVEFLLIITSPWKAEFMKSKLETIRCVIQVIIVEVFCSLYSVNT